MSAHTTEVTERTGRGAYGYDVKCACGWSRIGFDYRFQAWRAGQQHEIDSREEAHGLEGR